MRLPRIVQILIARHDDAARPERGTPTALAERALDALDQTAEPNLAMWTALVKRLAETASPVLTGATCSRLVVVWQRISSTSRSGDQQCSLLASAADLCVHSHVTRHWMWIRPMAFYRTCIHARAIRTRRFAPPQCACSASSSSRPTPPTLAMWIWRKSRRCCTTCCGAKEEASGGYCTTHRAWCGNVPAGRLPTRSRRVCAVALALRIASGRIWARYCVAAGRDMEGVAVSACRASGSLLAICCRPRGRERSDSRRVGRPAVPRAGSGREAAQVALERRVGAQPCAFLGRHRAACARVGARSWIGSPSCCASLSTPKSSRSG